MFRCKSFSRSSQSQQSCARIAIRCLSTSDGTGPTLSTSSAFTGSPSSATSTTAPPSTNVDANHSQTQSNHEPQRHRQSQRVWKADSTERTTWDQPIVNSMDMTSLLERIGKQELLGGRMRQRQLGVLREDPAEDMRLLIDSYTVPSLASALRDREEILQHAAELLKNGELQQLETLLRPFQHVHILARRNAPYQNLALTQELTLQSLELLRQALRQMPRRVTSAHSKRAGVVVCLANVHGIPSIIFEKRAPTLRAHPDEVCLPGGISMETDQSIVATCLREMQEEIPNLPPPQSVLGILRCNWGEVHHLVGVAVTPLVAFVGEIGELQLQPNPEEVAEIFTIPLQALVKRDLWIHREGFAPIFVGGPHVIWGLTGYIIERFVKDILLRYNTTASSPSSITATVTDEQ